MSDTRIIETQRAHTSKHLIFGAGLIGGYLAGCFMSQGLNVELVGRDNTKKKLQHGLMVSDYLGHVAQVSAPIFVNCEHKNTTVDIIWLTVKCIAVTEAINELKCYINSNTVIICCQNGFGSDAPIRSQFPNNIVLQAVVGFNVVELADAQLQRATQGSLIIESHARTRGLFNKLDSALLPTQLSTDITAERWAKLQLNLANPINALANMPIKTMLEDRGYRKVIVGLMNEHLRVVNALGIKLPRVTAVPGALIPKIMSLPNWLFERVAQQMLAIDPEARTSMWWDLNSKRKTEIHYINGAVVKQAQELNIDCPINERVIGLIERVERGDEKLGVGTEHMHALLFG